MTTRRPSQILATLRLGGAGAGFGHTLQAPEGGFFPGTLAAPDTASPWGKSSRAQTVPSTERRPGKAAPSSPAPASRAQAAPNCNPNCTFDSDGNRIFKPECFHRRRARPDRARARRARDCGAMASNPQT
ncbi:MAG: hypothetical protein ACRENE_04690, partial [Polyangiaceae bacterium]